MREPAQSLRRLGGRELYGRAIGGYSENPQELYCLRKVLTNLCVTPSPMSSEPKSVKHQQRVRENL